MSTEVKLEWTWTGYVDTAFLGEPEIFVTADVHSDGVVLVTGVSIIDTPLTQDAQGKWVRGKQQIVQLDGSDDAFSLALFARIKADLEIDRAFIEQAIEEAGDDAGDFYMSGGRKRCPDEWRENQLDAQESSAPSRL